MADSAGRLADLAVAQGELEGGESAVGRIAEAAVSGTSEPADTGTSAINDQLHGTSTDDDGVPEVLGKATARVGERWSSRTTRLRFEKQSVSAASTSPSSLALRHGLQCKPVGAVVRGVNIRCEQLRTNNTP